MSLDMKKVYIDSRFRTKNSKSERDFFVELPRTFSVPDGVIAHIDDIVIPQSWSAVDARNNICYTELTMWKQSKKQCVFTSAQKLRWVSIRDCFE